jgi:uncharacterized protein YlbG (UPF0298 family)
MFETETEIQAPIFEMSPQRAVYVFYRSYKQVRELNKIAEVRYTSRKMRYALMYIDEAVLEETVEKIQSLHFVKDVKVSAIDEVKAAFVKEA